MHVLRWARVPGRDGLWDIEISAAGVVTALRPAGGPDRVTDYATAGGPDVAGPPAAVVTDANGRAVIPGLVDAHVHLDKAYLLEALARVDGGASGGGLAAAISATRALRPTLTLADTERGMRRVLAGMVRDGTVAARVHVEIDPAADPATVQAHREVAAGYPELRTQLVAFPQNGTSGRPSMPRLLERALDDGCAVVGGCPYADPEPERHLDLVFGLARDRGLPVDLHLDLTDDPALSQLDLVIPRIERAGLAGRVAVGHLTALATTPPDQLARRVRELARLDVTVVALPTTDLWLSGRDRFPSARGLAPLRALLAGGVRVALGTNNHQNAFTPVGAGGLLRMAWLASLVAHIGDPAGHAALLAAVTSVPAELLGLGPWGVGVGSQAPLLVLEADEVLDAVREAPPIRHRVGAWPEGSDHDG
jgi:cytosine deaminase